jgi:AbrB family looped-hinge helix DNA binding protein
MTFAILTSKSRVTLPKQVREALGAEPGDKIRFVPTSNGFDLVVIKQVRQGGRACITRPRRDPAIDQEVDLSRASTGGSPKSRAEHKR